MATTQHKIHHTFDDSDDYEVETFPYQNVFGSINFDDIKKTLSSYEYTFEKIIGRGASSIVILVNSLKYQKLFACKISPSPEPEKDEFYSLKKEISIVKRLYHNNIVKIYEIFNDDRYNYLVMEYYPKGNLAQWIDAQSHIPYSTFVSFAKQIISAIDYCHSRNIAHSDIKPENILMDQFCRPVFIDFGFSQVIQPGHLTNIHCGSPAFCAPELHKSFDFDPYKADIWSTGMTLYYLLEEGFSQQKRDVKQFVKSVKDGTIEFSKGKPQEATELILQMLSINPFNRPPASQIIDFPIFTKRKPQSTIATLFGANIKTAVHRTHTNINPCLNHLIVPAAFKKPTINNFRAFN